VWTGWATDHFVHLVQSVVSLSIRPWTLLGWPMCFCYQIPIEPENEVQATSTSPRPAPWSSEFRLQPSKLVLGVSTICFCNSRVATGRPARRRSQRQGWQRTTCMLILISFLLYSSSIISLSLSLCVSSD
jgi:hypothetical protein